MRIWRAVSDMPKDLRGGFQTHWTSYGHGPRQAVLIHCTLAHAGAWTGLSAHLGDMANMIAFDLPSHGRSDVWTPEAGDTQMLSVNMAADFIDGPVDLIGHSFGATVALRLAVERPDLVRSLVLCEPVFFAIARADDPAGQTQSEADMREFMEALDIGDMETAGRSFVDYWDGAGKWDSLTESARKSVTTQMAFIAAGEATLYEDTAGLIESGALEKIEAPTLLIDGADSPKSMGTINTGLAARIPNATRTIIFGAGHMVPISHPMAVAAEIKAFWRMNPA